MNGQNLSNALALKALLEVKLYEDHTAKLERCFERYKINRCDDCDIGMLYAGKWCRECQTKNRLVFEQRIEGIFD